MTVRSTCLALSLVTVMSLSGGSASGQVFEQELVPAEPFEDGFGQALALEGDTLAVGAPGDNDLGSDSGSVSVFVHDGQAWQRQVELLGSPSAGSSASFGHALALDGERLLVGAPGESDGSWLQPGFQRGAAYVFERSGGEWTLAARLQPPAALTGDLCGWAVALSGDVAVLGAPLADPAGDSSGTAWVHRLQAGVWVEEAELQPPGAGAGQRFGSSLALGGGSLFVGAPVGDGAVPASGVVHRFERVGAAWVHQQTLSAADGLRNDRFGRTLDWDAGTLAVGAPWRSVSGRRHAGAVALFEDLGSWSQVGWLVAADPGARAAMGSSLALQAGRVLAGAPEDGDAGAQSGAAYLFVRTAGAWAQAAKLLSEAATPVDASGSHAVALHAARAAIGTVYRPHLPLLGQGCVDVWAALPESTP